MSVSLNHRAIPGPGSIDPDTSARYGVPWSTAVPLAVGLGLADGYWMMSLRGAIGAINRSQGPFADWLFESTLSVPLYLAVVLACFMVAVRWFGPALVTARAVATTAVLVVVATTAVGLAELSASAAYDYHLQGSQTQMMDDMAGGHCGAACLAATNHSALEVQIRGLLLGSRLLLITNLVLVAWLVAARGGRLPVTRVTPSAHRWRPPTVPRTRVELARLGIVAALLGAGIVHAAVAIGQLTTWPLAALFFLVLSGAEAVLAIRLALDAARPSLTLAAALAATTLAAWLSTRVFGLPLTPVSGVPAHVMLPGWAVCSLDVVILAAAVGQLRTASRIPRPVPRLTLTHPAWAAGLTVCAMTVFGLAATGPL
jgi:hypothetical protein